jgi:glycosyltransferase involved in cell wall biosynthesis
MKLMDSGKVLVAIPAFNEAESLPSVLNNLISNYPHAKILLIDDGSLDDTLKIAKEFPIYVVSHPFNLGVGSAMRTAFRFAIQFDFDYLVQFDADGQHSVDSLEIICKELLSSDVVVGNRFESEQIYRMSLARRLAIKFLSQILFLFGGQRIEDPTSGNRGAGSKAIRLFSELYPTEYLGDTVGSLAIALQNKLTIKEIPVQMSQRVAGSPSQTTFKSVRNFARITLILFFVSRIPKTRSVRTLK